MAFEFAFNLIPGSMFPPSPKNTHFASSAEQMRCTSRRRYLHSFIGRNDNPQWVLREKVLEEAKAFAACGLKLKSLVFDRNLVQVFGDTAILYVNFDGELSNGEEWVPMSGPAVEIFVRRDGQWLNTGWFLQQDQK